MMRIVLAIFLTMSSVHAGVENLKVVNFNLNYVAPHGTGDVENLNFGFSTPDPGPHFVSYPMELEKTDTTIDLRTPFLDLSWYNPWKIIHSMEKLKAEQLNLNFNKKIHTASGKLLSLKTPGLGTLLIKDLKLECRGDSSSAQFEQRILEDCSNNLVTTVKYLDLPLNFFMNQIVKDLPPQKEMTDKPADNLTLSVKKGDLYMEVFTRVVFYAGIRIWGKVTYENDYSTIAIRVTQAKFGAIPITRLLLSNIRKMAQPPYVIVKDNVIKININFK